MALKYFSVGSIFINGQQYAAGDEVEGLTSSQAALFLKRGLLTADTAPPTPAEIVASIVEDVEALGALADALGVTLPG